MHRDPLSHFRRLAAALADQAVHAAYGFETSTAAHFQEAPEGRGDLALPCFPLAADAKAAPHDIAAKVVEAMASEPSLHVDAAGPYINFTITPSALVDHVLGAVRELAAEYGTHEPTGEAVLVEHTSANPTGPLHVGRARNPILGDTLARVLRAAGHDVTTEYYVNDMGRQAAMLVWGARRFGRGDHDKPDHALVESYQRAASQLEDNEAGDAEVRELIARFESGDDETASLFHETVNDALDGIRQTLERLGVHHDNFKFESELVLGGAVSEVLDGLRKLEVLGQEDGAEYLDVKALGSRHGKERFFITRADGTTLYGTRDIAYHADKLARADRLIDVLGEDHKLAFEHVALSLAALGRDAPMEAVFYNFVSLPEGKMSTRRGRVVYIDDLMEEAETRAYAEVEARRSHELDEDTMRRVAALVGLGAIRFNIVGVQAEKPITFVWEDALAFDGSSAPFVQYSHARACGILARAAQEGHEPWVGDLSSLDHDSELALVRAIGRYPGLIGECASELKAHPLTAYAVELATRLNHFYRDCPVLQADTSGQRDDRLSLVDATRQTLANVLDVLGIVAPESM